MKKPALAGDIFKLPGLLDTYVSALQHTALRKWKNRFLLLLMKQERESFQNWKESSVKMHFVRSSLTALMSSV